MQKVYVVQLSSQEREQLQELVKKGNREKGQRPSALKLTRARILLKADQTERAPAYTDAEIAEALDVSPKTVFNADFRRLISMTILGVQVYTNASR